MYGDGSGLTNLPSGGTGSSNITDSAYYAVARNVRVNTNAEINNLTVTNLTVDSGSGIGYLSLENSGTNIITLNGTNGTITVAGYITATNFYLTTPQWTDLAVNYGYSSIGPSAPSLTATTNNSAVQQLAFDNGDMLYATAQLPHNIATTNAGFPEWKFHPHVHFTTIGTLDSTHSNVTWRIEWEMASINALWTLRGTNSVTYGVSNNFQHCVVSLGWITNNPPPSISAVFRCRLMRPASVAQDYSNAHDVLFDGMDLHIPVGNTTISGSREEFSQ